MISVQLNNQEVKNSHVLATERYSVSRKMGLKNTCTYDEDLFGMQGEIACAKGLKIPFTSNLNTFKGADLPGSNIQVRATKYFTGRLIIKDNDKPEYRYLLVRGDGVNFKLVGWCSGSTAKAVAVDEVHNGRTLHFVPTHELLDPELLVVTHEFKIKLKGEFKNV